MDCKITYTRRAGRRARGFTLIEALVTLAISGIAFAALASFTMFSGRNFAGMFNYVDMERRSQNAIDTMSREIRNMLYVTDYKTNSIILRHIDGNLVTYSWSPDSKALVRVKGGVSKVLLADCDYLGFTIWQRSPIAGTWENYTTDTVTNAKLVNVSWRCSRKILGVAMNTESVQTSKIAIRNR